MRGALRRGFKPLSPATYVGSAGSPTNTIVKPAGLLEGDLMFVHHAHAPLAAGINGGSGGWSHETVYEPTYGYYAHLWWKVVTADDVSSSLSVSSVSANAMTASAYRGPINAVVMGTATSGNGVSTLTLTRSTKNNLSLGQVVFTDDRDESGAYGTPPVGWSTRTNVAGEFFRMSSFDLIDGSQSSASGSDTFTAYTATYPQRGFNVELRGDPADQETFDPSKLSTIKAWWSPEYGVTKDGSDRVSAWADKIGGHTVSQATSGNQPLWVANASSQLGGTLPLMHFTDASRYLEMASFPASFPTGDAETWIFAASRLTATGTVWSPAILGYGGQRGIGSAGANWITQPPYPVDQFMVMRSGGSDAFQAPPSMLTNTIVGARFGSGGIRGRRNGSQVGSSADGVSITTGNLRIGRRTNGNDNIFGYVGDIIVTGALTVREAHKLEAWLAWRYAQQGLLPTGHPFKSAAP